MSITKSLTEREVNKSNIILALLTELGVPMNLSEQQSSTFIIAMFDYSTFPSHTNHL